VSVERGDMVTCMQVDGGILYSNMNITGSSLNMLCTWVRDKAGCKAEGRANASLFTVANSAGAHSNACYNSSLDVHC